jgi:hypothetical protein
MGLMAVPLHQGTDCPNQRLSFVRKYVITDTLNITQQQGDLTLRLKIYHHRPLEASLSGGTVTDKRHIKAQLRACKVGVSLLSGRGIPHHITFRQMTTSDP